MRRYRYHIKKKLASGGMANVFLAEDTLLHRNVAIKMLHRHLLQKSESIRRFELEAHSIASLSHDNIIKVYDYGKIQNRLFIAMEYIDGYTLGQVIEKELFIPNLVFLEALMQICAGLEHIHNNKIYHRDIKPANIMVDRSGKIKIMDFGIAFLVDQKSITMTGSFVGSPGHISPEQIQGTALNEKTDIFSLGSLAYTCITGKHPFDADAPHLVIHRIASDTPATPASLKPNVLLWLSDLVMACLDKNPNNRPSAGQIRSEIEFRCHKEGIHVAENERLSQFIKEGALYAPQENQEIFDLYLRLGDSLRGSSPVAAIRAYEQARRFGELPDNRDVLLHRKQKIKRASWIAFVSLLVAAIGGRLYFVQKRSEVSLPRSKSEQMNTKRHDDRIRSEQLDARENEGASRENRTNETFVKAVSDTILNKNTNKNETIANRNQVSHAPTKSSETESFGYLEIKSNPPWAAIEIDQMYMGKTPERGVVRIEEGMHKVSLTKAGFLPYEAWINVEAEETLFVKCRLHYGDSLTD
jgi:serine/threonine protein kinase